MDKKKLKADIILITIILVIGLASWIWVSVGSKAGQYVVVKVNGVETERHSLTDNGTYPLNGGSNILIIKDGEAYLTDANCPDKLCVKQGKIHLTGQAITCLPNKLTVTVEGKSNSDIDIFN